MSLQDLLKDPNYQNAKNLILKRQSKSKTIGEIWFHLIQEYKVDYYRKKLIFFNLQSNDLDKILKQELISRHQLSCMVQLNIVIYDPPKLPITLREIWESNIFDLIYQYMDEFSMILGKSVNLIENDHHNLSPPKKLIIQGISNLGQTCWFNSSIQALTHVTPFITNLISQSDGLKKYIRSKPKSARTTSSINFIDFARKKSEAEINHAKIFSDDQKSVKLFEREQVRSFWQNICAPFGELGNNASMAQDASEFIQALLDTLATNFSDGGLNDNNNLISQFFRLSTSRVTEYMACDIPSTTENEAHSMLYLGFPNENELDTKLHHKLIKNDLFERLTESIKGSEKFRLIDLLRNHFSGEQLSDYNCLQTLIHQLVKLKVDQHLNTTSILSNKKYEDQITDRINKFCNKINPVTFNVDVTTYVDALTNMYINDKLLRQESSNPENQEKRQLIYHQIKKLKNEWSRYQKGIHVGIFSDNCQDANFTIRHKQYLSELPKYLIIGLKRTVFDQLTAQSKKISAHIDRPINDLDLSEFTSEKFSGSAKYNLISQVVHWGVGTNAAGGHYTADVKIGSQWWYTSDSSVRSIEIKDLNSSAHGYFYIYKRI